MKKLLLVTAALSFAASALADTGTIGYVYSPRTKSFYECGLKSFGTLRNVLGSKRSLDLSGLVGVGYKDRPLLGVAGTVSLKFAENGTITLGPVVFVENRRPAGYGVFAGVTWRF